MWWLVHQLAAGHLNQVSVKSALKYRGLSRWLKSHRLTKDEPSYTSARTTMIPCS
jgi:hypothetical protein